MQVRAAVGEPLVLQLEDGDGSRSEAKTDFIGVLAQKRPLTLETLQKQLSRLGTTVFSLQELQADIQGDVMQRRTVCP